MRNWAHIAVVAATLSLLSGCRPTPDGHEPLRRFGVPSGSGGCYELARAEDKAKVYLTRARSFQLDTARVSAQHPDLHRVITAPAESLATRMSLWSADSLSDTLRISIGDGLTGITLATVQEGTVLTGEVSAWGDAGPWSNNLGRVRFTKIACAAE